MQDFRAQGDELSYCGQITVGQVGELAALGFRSIVCNRPDSEEGAVPSSNIRQAARALGMSFIYQPVEFSMLGLEDGKRFAEALDTLPKPVLAYCRSGRRSAALWVLGRAPQMGVNAALAASRESGCDLDDLRPRLQESGLDC
jgi:sulfide:quinone oxidoreductase